MKRTLGRQTRREFIKQAGYLGAAICLATEKSLSAPEANKTAVPEATTAFQFRSVSIRHVPELREWMSKLDRSGRFSANQTWRSYVGSFQYVLPKTLAKARSLVILSSPLKIATIAFNISGKKRAVIIPPGYVDDGLQLADYQDLLYKNNIVEKGRKLERARLPLKQLAVRSGLATYGRNNITFVEGYGSFHQLLAFYTDQPLQDHWGMLKMLRLCKGCSICLQECPTGAIRESDFVIDPAKCITLYNELPDPMPAWIPSSAHNALVGCLKCQFTCPGNEDMVHDHWNLGDVSSQETAALLSGRIDEAMAAALKAKFKRVGGGDDLSYIARNLKLVLGATEAQP